MSQSARVTSIEALKDFRAALCDFGVDAKEALCATELEIRHLLDWLEQQLKNWQREVRKRQEELVRAKNELVQKKYSQRDGRGPGYTEQQVAFERAQARLQEAEWKVERTRHWTHVLPRDVTEYEGPARQLSGMLDSELAHAVALLDQKIDALEAYVKMQAPSTPESASTGNSVAEQNSSVGTTSSPSTSQAAAVAADESKALPETEESQIPCTSAPVGPN